MRETSPNQLKRDELEAIQANALRSWRSNIWLEEHRPADALRLDSQPEDEVLLDLTAGSETSEQVPGAVAVGPFLLPSAGLLFSVPARAPRQVTIPERPVDIHWDLRDGIPAEARTIDRAWIGRGALSRGSKLFLGMLAKELGRTVVSNGLVMLRDTAAGLTTFVPLLEDVGFSVEGTRSGDTRRLRLLAARTRLEDLQLPVDERIFGRREPQRIRQPTTF